ncbi:MAG: Hsp20/alpha crystallin family protein [Bryobacteraceae bacterium]
MASLTTKPDAGKKSDPRETGEERDLTPTFAPLWTLRPGDFFNMSPFTLMRRFTEEMDRAFQGLGGASARGWAPPVEVSEEEGKLKVSAELPGIRKDDVHIEIAEDSLIIQGERKSRREESGEGFVRSERSYGRFYRCVPLPAGAKSDQAEARFQDGMLEVTIPVLEAAHSRREIPIRTDKPGGKQTS